MTHKAHVESGQVLHQLPTPDGTYTLAFHPKELVLVYAPDEKKKERESVVEMIG